MLELDELEKLVNRFTLNANEGLVIEDMRTLRKLIREKLVTFQDVPKKDLTDGLMLTILSLKIIDVICAREIRLYEQGK